MFKFSDKSHISHSIPIISPGKRKKHVINPHAMIFPIILPTYSHNKPIYCLYIVIHICVYICVYIYIYSIHIIYLYMGDPQVIIGFNGMSWSSMSYMTWMMQGVHDKTKKTRYVSLDVRRVIDRTLRLMPPFIVDIPIFPWISP